MKNVIQFPIDTAALIDRRSAALGKEVDAARVAEGKTSIGELTAGTPAHDEALDDVLRRMLIALGEDPDDDSFETFEACIARLDARGEFD